jgi:hypothetical protein
MAGSGTVWHYVVSVPFVARTLGKRAPTSSANALTTDVASLTSSFAPPSQHEPPPFLDLPSSLPKPPVPKPSPRTTLRLHPHLSYTASPDRALPCSAVLRAALAGFYGMPEVPVHPKRGVLAGERAPQAPGQQCHGRGMQPWLCHSAWRPPCVVSALREYRALRAQIVTPAAPRKALPSAARA